MNFKNSNCLANFSAALLIAGISISVWCPPANAQTVATAATVSQEDEKEEKEKGYEFTIQHQVECSDVKSQGSTGTCWCFATTSFIESELLRQEKGEHDLSEIFVVKNVYLNKAHNYLRRQGKTNFGEGALAHDYIRAASEHGFCLLYTSPSPRDRG